MLLACASSAVLCFACPVLASDVCRLTPYGEMGQSGVLGFYYGGGLRCQTDHVTLTVGGRSTQLGGGALQPVAGISYTNMLLENVSFSLKTTLRERIGDYEVNALPELSLAWALPHGSHDVQVIGTASWGSYLVTTVPMVIQRTQIKASAAWPAWHLSRDVQAAVALTSAYQVYSTGDTSTWVEADFITWGRLSSSVDWSWGVGDRNGSGTSPLKFDGNSADAWTSAALTFHVSPKWDVSVRGTYDFYSSTMSSVQLELRTTVFGGRPITFSYEATGGAMTGTYDWPGLGNIGLRYDRTAVYMVFEPH